MENLLQQWEESHFRKMFWELRELGIEPTLENIPRIVETMSFTERSIRMYGKNECPYYDLGRPCHTLPGLNCFWCACPEYMSESLEGGCRMRSPLGKWVVHKNLPAGKVWDCSKCIYGHDPEFVRQYLETNLIDLARKYDSEFGKA